MNDCERALELINSYIDGDISDADREFLMSHIASCPECSQIFDILTGVSEAFAEDAEPPEELLTGVMAGVRAVNAESKTVPIASARKMTVRWIAVAACAVIVVSMGVFAFRGKDNKSSGNETAFYSVMASQDMMMDAAVPAEGESLVGESAVESYSTNSSFDGDEDVVMAVENNDAIVAADDDVLPKSTTAEYECEVADANKERNDDGDYAYLSARYGKILYVDELPEAVVDAEPVETEDGTEYYELSAEELPSVEENLDSLNINYALCDIEDNASETIAIVVTRQMR